MVAASLEGTSARDMAMSKVFSAHDTGLAPTFDLTAAVADHVA
jgi:hypothetical protein